MQETVRTTTSVSVKRSKDFETPIGIFSYEHIPITAFPFGIEQRKQYFIASPVKALADMIYSRNRAWDSLNDLTDDLRIDPDSVQESDKKTLTELIENYPSQRVKRVLSIFAKELKL